MEKPSNFYNKLSKDIIDDVEEFCKYVDQDGIDMAIVMFMYFGEHWSSFKEFFERSGEKIDWIGFALVPHNATLFVQWVFRKYPEVRETVMRDLRNAQTSSQSE